MEFSIDKVLSAIQALQEADVIPAHVQQKIVQTCITKVRESAHANGEAAFVPTINNIGKLMLITSELLKSGLAPEVEIVEIRQRIFALCDQTSESLGNLADSSVPEIILQTLTRSEYAIFKILAQQPHQAVSFDAFKEVLYPQQGAIDERILKHRLHTITGNLKGKLADYGTISSMRKGGGHGGKSAGIIWAPKQ